MTTAGSTIEGLSDAAQLNIDRKAAIDGMKK